MSVTGWIDELGRQEAADAVVEVRARQMRAGCERVVLAAHWADLHNAESAAAHADPAAAGGAGGAGAAGAVGGAEQARVYGGHGTPPVREFSVPELAVMLGTSPQGAGSLVADALDLRHRLPRLWALVRDGKVWEWQARRVARETRNAELTAAQAGWVDAQVAPYLVSLPWLRFLDLVLAKVVEVDPEAAEARRVAAAMARFVQTGQCNEFGLTTVIAKATSGDAVFFVGMCDRIAACLAADGDDDPVDVRRSKAIGVLADPAAALALLVAHARVDSLDPGGHDSTVNGTAEGADDVGGAAADGPARSAGDTATGLDRANPGADGDDADSAANARGAGTDGPGGTGSAAGMSGRCGGCGHRVAALAGRELSRVPEAFVRAVERIDPASLRPQAVLYVHVSRESFDAARRLRRGTGNSMAENRYAEPGAQVAPDARDSECVQPVQGGPVVWPAGRGSRGGAAAWALAYGARPLPGVARVEGCGPVTPAQAVEFLGHAHVHLKPVIDLETDAPVDGYEVPARMREQLHLRTPACVFPSSPNLSRKKDGDHTVPYRVRSRGGPPGQTRIGNLGPLARTGHRVKTHAPGWRHHQPVPGVFLWRTPHGYWYRVDNTGTHPLGRHRADIALEDLLTLHQRARAHALRQRMADDAPERQTEQAAPAKQAARTDSLRAWTELLDHANRPGSALEDRLGRLLTTAGR